MNKKKIGDIMLKGLFAGFGIGAAILIIIMVSIGFITFVQDVFNVSF